MKGKNIIKGLLAAGLVMMTACTKHEASIESTEDNTVKVTALNSEESGGSGIITVGEGEILHVDYKLSKGTFDITVAGEPFEPAEITNVDASAPEMAETTEQNAQDIIDAFTGEGQYKETGLTGEGSLEFAVQPGDQTLYIMLHDATGEILITAVPE